MKEKFLDKWIIWFKGELIADNAVIISRPSLIRLLECMLRFGAAFILSGAEIFGQYRPFAIALMAASGCGLEGLFALLGGSLGYILLAGISAGLKYVSVLVLVASIAYIFKDLSISDKPQFMPLAAGLISFIIGFVFEYDAGLMLPSLVYFLTELGLVVALSHYFRLGLMAVDEDDEAKKLKGHRLGLLLLLGAGCIALNQIVLVANMTLGRVAASIVLLSIVYRGGAMAAMPAGFCLGLAIDMSQGTLPMFSMIYAFSGMIGGALSLKGRLLTACGFVVSNFIASLWVWNTAMLGSILYEVFVASVVFMLLPVGWLSRLSAGAREEAVENSIGMGVLDMARRKLEAASAAFKEVCESLSMAISVSKTNDNNVSSVFDRTADKVCRKCVLANHCWEKNYISTYNALNDATVKILERGKSLASDYPLHFSSKCKNFDLFVARVNEELTAMKYRAHYRNKLMENRKLVCEQYSGVSEILRSAAMEISGELSVSVKAERKLRRHLKSIKVEAEAVVYNDHLGRVKAEISGNNLTSLIEDEMIRGKISTALGIKFGEPLKEVTHTGQKLVFSELEPFTATVGVCGRQKNGESVNGDYGTYFKTENGRMYVILSDGMGTGPAAARESLTAVRLLERLLKAGTPPKTAMLSLNSAFLLRNDEELSFATIDLLQVSLFTGETVFYKWGAAPSFIKRGDKVSRIGGGSLPPGVFPEDGSEVSRQKLQDNDFVIVLSDGVTDKGGDDWLLETASGYEGESPGELAGLILEKAEAKQGCQDDMTIFVFKMERQ